jgi:hypothetical protein
MNSALRLLALGWILAACSPTDSGACVHSLNRTVSSSVDVADLNQDVDRCFDDDPSEMERQASVLPIVVGRDLRNGLDLVAIYHCSDACPEYGGVRVVYVDVAETSCASVGGRVVTDEAWGSYIGCSPL